MSRDRSPPCPISASVRLSTRSPAGIWGKARSNVVACENMPQVGIPSTALPSQIASHRRLPGWAGAPCRSIRAPSRGSPPTTGSSGSSALAPPAIRTSAPSRRAACAPEGRVGVGHAARRAAGVLEGQEAPAEPFDLLLQRGLEARALLGVEALLRHHADRRRPEAVDGHQAARGAGDLLDGGDRLGGDDERRNLALAERLARLDRLR